MRQAISVSLLRRIYAGEMPAGRPPKLQKRNAFGQRLFEARQAKGLSQKEVAEALRVTQPSYADWERTAVSLKPELLPKLAEVLGVSVDHLLGAQGRPRSSNGPIGKLRKVFEAASALPRYQQQRVIAIVEDILISYHTKASQDRD